LTAVPKLFFITRRFVEMERRGMSEAPDASKAVRGRPFSKGNGGRKVGSVNRATRVAAALLDGEEEELMRKAIELAKGGDIPMLKFVLGRLLPRDRTIKIDLPTTFSDDQDTMQAIARVIAAMADGKISPSEADAIASLIERYRRAAEQSDLSARMDELQRALARNS
jgi:hypothetical protein